MFKIHHLCHNISQVINEFFNYRYFKQSAFNEMDEDYYIYVVYDLNSSEKRKLPCFLMLTVKLI